MRALNIIRNCFLITLFIYPPLLHSKGLAICSFEISSYECRGFQDSNTHLYNFLNFYLDNQNPNVALFDLYEKALRNASAGSNEIAQQIFKQIIAQSTEHDHKQNERQLIFQSFLFLASLDNSNKYIYYSQALGFDEDWGLLPARESDEQNDKLTAILSDYRLYKKQNTTKIQIPSHIFQGFDWLLVNGQIFDLTHTDEIILCPGDYRFTLLSNFYKPQTFKMSVQQLLLLDPPKIPLVLGTCKSANLNVGLNNTSVQVYFNKICQRHWDGLGWDSISDITSKQSDKLQENSNGQSRISNENWGSNEPFYKKTWFHVAVATIVGFVVYKNLNHKEATSAPANINEVY